MTTKVSLSPVFACALSLSLLVLSIAAADGKAGHDVKTTKLIKGVSYSSGPAINNDQALKTQLQELTRVLAASDAAGVAKLWAQDGTYTNEDGQTWQGRSALEKRFAGVFASQGRILIDFIPTSTRYLSDRVAMVDGFVKLKEEMAGEPETRFSMVFQKQDDGTWLMASASETHYLATAPGDHLRPLRWLIGDWAIAKDGSSMQLKAEWAADKKFIHITQKVKKSDRANALDSQQIIGWDPRSEQIVSWSFDAVGGFGSGVWLKRGDKWMIDSSGVEQDGRITRATDIMGPDGLNAFSWQSVRRSVDGQPYTDTVPLKIQRQTVKL